MKKRFTMRSSSHAERVIALALVAERRSFRAAASQLGVSVSAVSQTVRALEAQTGVALLARTTRTVALTEAGRRFLDRAQPAAEQLLAAFDAARSDGERVSGLLRLNVPRSVIARLINPLIFEFSLRHPQLQIEVYADDDAVDIIAEGFDAGMRLGDAIPTDMVGVRMTEPFRFVVAGSPDYFLRHGRPKQIEDLAEHRCIRMRKSARDAIRSWSFVQRGRPKTQKVDGPLIVNDLELNIAAARRGHGLSYVPRPLIEPFLTSGQLEAVLEPFSVQTPGVFLYYPNRRQVLPKLRAFINFVRRPR